MAAYKEYIFTSEENGETKWHKKIAKSKEDALKMFGETIKNPTFMKVSGDVVVVIRMKNSGNIYTVKTEEEMIAFLTDIIRDKNLLQHMTRPWHLEDYFICESVSQIEFEAKAVVFSWHNVSE